MSTQKVWFLMDNRRRASEDEGIVFEVCFSLKEAKRNASDYGDDIVIVEAITKGRAIIESKIVN